jgi:hypothetical protein
MSPKSSLPGGGGGGGGAAGGSKSLHALGSDDGLSTSPPQPFEPPSPSPFGGAAPPIHAVFSPGAPLSSSSTSKAARANTHRSTILIHQKSPLLLATPPQITRALAYSHPFLLPLNKLVGLISWTTGDPWESFLLVAAFWAFVLYGDALTRYAAPIFIVAGMILGMYGRRFSPLSSSGWSETTNKDGTGWLGAMTGFGASSKAGSKTAHAKTASVDIDRLGHQRGHSVEATNTRHQKTLDEIVETLKEFTARCNILLEPLFELTDFMSTQRTPTSATTKPAMTALFIRIIMCTPFWVALTLPPLRIITTRRVVLVTGTIILTWHARVMRIARVILWRSASMRRLAALTTGLNFEGPTKPSLPNIPTINLNTATTAGAATLANGKSAANGTRKVSSSHHLIGKARDAGVKFTFIIYENQRRWMVLGWTANMLAYERTAWTDEHSNPVPPRDEFELPEVEEGSNMRWRWVPGSRWRVDGVHGDDLELADYDGDMGAKGWIYYDNKWQNGRRGVDGWGKWTRRRKWYRDAELVEVEDPPPQELEAIPPVSPSASPVRSRPPTDTLSISDDSHKSAHTTSAAIASLTELAERDAAAKADRARHPASPNTDDTTSVRSFFRPSSLRRRPTDKSGASKRAPSSDAASRRSRRSLGVDDDADDDSGTLGLEVEMELRREGGNWGIGDEARMGLE